MKGIGKSSLAVAALAVGGCLTVREPVAPEVTVAKIPNGKVISVQLAGFDAQLTKYVPAYGYGTVTTFDGPVYCGYGRYSYGGIGTATLTTTSFLPQTEATPAFRDRATDFLEHAGCLLQTKDPQYRVEVRFDGPFTESGDGWAAAGWSVCTLFTADFGAQDWTAKLKIHDLKTGRLLYERDYTQRYEAVVWGPIPFFSPLSSEATSDNTMQCWCLTSLTDVAAADALAFLVSVAK